MNEKLQKEISDWLEYRAKFADYANHIEIKMQMMFTDWMGDYEGKDDDLKQVCASCKNVEEAYIFIQGTLLNVHREYWKRLEPLTPQEG